jgi:hypothetical protein
MWQMAQAYRTRPSQLLAVEHETTAYFLDRAVFLFGRSLDNELETAGKGKSQKRQAMARSMVLHRWLDRGGFNTPKG